MSGQLTASALPRVSKCPASAPGILPRSFQTSEAAENGTALHAFLDACLKTGRDQALVQCSERWPDMVPAFEAIDLDQLPAGKPESFSSEVPFAVNMITGGAVQISPHDSQHQYPELLDGPWVYGTADIVGIAEDRVVVYDYKTGRAPLGAPKKNWQLKLLAYAAARIYGKDAATVALVRVMPDRPPQYLVAELDAMDLAAIPGELLQLRAKIMEQEARNSTGLPMEFHPGEHCRYCPAFFACQAQLGPAGALAAGLDRLPTPDELLRLTPAMLGATWVKIQNLTKLAGLVEDALKEVASHTPLELPGGGTLAAVMQSRETVDGGVVRRVLMDDDMLDIADEAVELHYKTSKDSIKKAIKASRGLKGKELDEFADGVMVKVRRHGGTRESSFLAVKEITPKEKTK